MIKLYIALNYYIVKQHIEERAKKKWYYSCFPKSIFKAFTLAEVLITLIVIGVVAGLTIPSLLNNIGDQQNKIAWRKAFADISQATNRIIIDNGGSLKGIFINNDSESIKNVFRPYLNYIKDCSSSGTGCWHISLKYLNNTTSVVNFPSLILSNGSLVGFSARGDNTRDCSHSYGDYFSCGDIYVDVNGFLAPNQEGKDIFELSIRENGVFPKGMHEDVVYKQVSLYGCSSNASGQACSAQYLYQ